MQSLVPRVVVATVVAAAVACTGPEQPSTVAVDEPTQAATEARTPAGTEATTAPPTAASPAPTADPTAAPTQRSSTRSLPARPRLRRVRLRLERVAALKEPTALAVRSGDDGLYVTERPGRIRVVRDGEVTTLLDWRKRTKGGHEQGMLGLAFSQDGRHLYVYYIGKGDEHSYLDQYTMDGDAIDRRSRRRVLVVRQPEPNVHKGGQLTLGPDGMLYLALGDGGPSLEPPDTAQRMDTLLGKILRIQPTPDGRRPYRVPRDNPFTQRRRARGEIFALGLRNPWRFSFDRDTHDLWVADVGRFASEEINFRRARAAAGANFGWPFVEGTSRRRSDVPSDIVAPLHEYPHDDRCAVIGGYVYRGAALRHLRGAYVYGDFCDGRIRALVRRGREVVDDRPLGATVPGLTSFAEDADGELYALSLQRGLLRIH